MRTQESSNYTVTKFAVFVHVVCDTMFTKLFGPKFVDPRTAAVSPYFKKSMVSADMLCIRLVHLAIYVQHLLNF